MSGGLKFDTDKLPTHLLSPYAIERALVYKFNNSATELTALENTFWDLAAWFRGDDLALDSAMSSGLEALNECGSSLFSEKSGLELAAWQCVADVLAYGAYEKPWPDSDRKGYGERNWEAGIKYTRLYAAAVRHLLCHATGVVRDHESGRLHLAHMNCCIMFLVHFDATGRGAELDDRPCRAEGLKAGARPPTIPAAPSSIARGVLNDSVLRADLQSINDALDEALRKLPLPPEIFGDPEGFGGSDY